MPNERKTERIVRSHFEKFNGLQIEEQSSDNIKIDKLLKTASKSSHLIGTEYQAHIFALAVSNMYIHQNNYRL